MKANWILVEEKLPEDNEHGFNRVIVCDAEGNVFQGSYDHEMQRWYGNDYCRIPDDGKERVIAWCEFPDPYRPLSISPSTLNFKENYGETH